MKNIFSRNVIIAALSSLITALLMGLYMPSYIEKNMHINNDDFTTQKISLNNSNNGEESNLPQIFYNDENIDNNDSNNNDISGTEEDENSGLTKILQSEITSVVGISSIESPKGTLFNSNEAEKYSVGSGVIVSDDGYILTNNHVVGNNPDELIVTLDNGKTINAKLEWNDPVVDIAVIKIDTNNLNPATLGDALKVKVGEEAIAIGNPLGLQFEKTVTKGIVSAINRTINIQTEMGDNYMEGLIQTDASINPGNSGGPLLNSNGEVIGINTIKVSSAEGMGFAIPINLCKPIVEGFIKEGKYETPYLGVFGLDRVVANYIHQDTSDYKGVKITEIDIDSPAYKGGVRMGDIITEIDGKQINSMLELRENICCCTPGNECKIKVIRNGKPMEIEFTMGNKNDDYSVTR